MVMVAVLFPAFMLFSMAAGQPSFSPQCDIRCQLLKDLQPIVQNASSRYNSSVSIAIDHPAFQVSLASGTIDFQTKQEALPSDLYALGSVTKTITGASIMRLVAEGKLHLNDRAHIYIDPMLVKAGYTYASLEDLFSSDRWSSSGGPSFNASHITVKDLLGMKSGVPDYDTDAWRHMQYTLSKIDFSPLQIFDFVHGPLQFKPGHPPPHSFSYCSVNFMLLGYVLAYFQEGLTNWAEVDQRAILPKALVDSKEVKFALKGPCRHYTQVHGYDSSQAVSSEVVDWSDASCLAGWTGGNVLMSARAAANWTAALYRASAEEVLPRHQVQQMIPKEGAFYGLATFNLTGFNGASGANGASWGHLGDTYGYTSITAYYPNMDFALAVATNKEGHGQGGPAEMVCIVYNMVQDAITSTPYRNCVYSMGSYYRGECVCK